VPKDRWRDTAGLEARSRRPLPSQVIRGAGGFVIRTVCTKKLKRGPSELRVRAWRWYPVTAAERVIRWTTALAVVGVAAVAAVASYEHAYALVRAHGEVGWTRRMVPLTVEGLIYASSMVMLDSARRKTPVPVLARWLLGLGIAATLAANVAHGLGHGPVGAVVAAWLAVALVGSYELLMMVIRSYQAVLDGMPDETETSDPLREQAAKIFADQLAADRVPSVRAIRAQLRVGQPRAQRLRDYLAAGAKQGESAAA
jgi:uncharacterized protein DUF2637